MSTIDHMASAALSALRGLLVGAMAWGGIVLPAPAHAAKEPDAAATLLSVEELQEVVGPIALYPDELVAIVLPASTWPLQIVQASRLLEKRKSDPNLQPDEDWDPSVIGLMNYPEVITLMNDDLDWTWKLGEAVAAQQDDVMNAIQAFRGYADEAGNLETNDKVTVQTETQGEEKIIVIESTSTEVIYVPQYNPTTVIVQQPAPYPYYYSSPYPYYYRPAAAFWTGMFVGAAIGWGCSWGWRGNNNINVNRNVNVNAKRATRPSTPNRPNRPSTGGKPTQWKADRKPGSQAGGRPGGMDRPGASTRPAGGSRPGGADRAGARPSAGGRDAKPGSSRPGGGDRSARPSTGASDRKTSAGGHSRSGGRDLTSPSSSKRSSRGSSMGSYGSGSSTRASTSRGASSRGGSRGGGRRGGGGGRRR